MSIPAWLQGVLAIETDDDAMMKMGGKASSCGFESGYVL